MSANESAVLRAGIGPDLLGLRYRGRASQQVGHVESWFMKANAPDGGRAFWTRLTILSSPNLAPVAEAWAIAFDRHRGHVAIKSTVAFETARFSKDRFAGEVDGCMLDLDRAKGMLSSGRGSLTWNVSLGAPRAAPIMHLPSRHLYRRGLPPFSKLVTPLSDVRARGSIKVERGGADDVDEWDVEGWPAMVGHNWGRGNAELYAWVHCNTFAADSPKGGLEDLVFEAISARVRVGPVLSPMATAAFVRYRGRSWDLSHLRMLGQNRATISLRRWEMTGGDGRDLQLVCDVAAETDDIVGLHYPNPTEQPTKLARARLEIRFPDGETIVKFSRAAALEIGTLGTDHGVRMYL
jgi:hypothetical protein